VLADTPISGVTDGRVRVVHLLHHGAHQAHEIGQLTLHERLAEVHVRQQTVKRVSMVAIRCRREESICAFSPIFGGLQCQLFLTVEMIEEAPFGEPVSFADILDSRGGVALTPEDMQSRIEEPGF